MYKRYDYDCFCSILRALIALLWGQNRANDIIGQTQGLLKQGFDEHDDLVNKGILPANEAFDFLDDLGFK